MDWLYVGEPTMLRIFIQYISVTTHSIPVILGRVATVGLNQPYPLLVLVVFSSDKCSAYVISSTADPYEDSRLLLSKNGGPVL